MGARIPARWASAPTRRPACCATRATTASSRPCTPAACARTMPRRCACSATTALRAPRRPSAPSARPSRSSRRRGAASSTATGRPRRSSSRSAAPRRDRRPTASCPRRWPRRGRTSPPAPARPPPRAEPRLDFRVDLASALAYEVRQGEYIQVIDVQGRQCSDFLAFHRGKLERGVERGLDGVTTRTLMGNAYPIPGLQGKFYDVDMDPLVEVVRDTVVRHDTFALACTPKYYEDMGYPGHISCTENFNGQLTPYGIAERKGWAALNFFYNTVFDASHVLVFDEPWSRPGDYVLLRAMTDLVCASSACPDDIDPANGWEITDVHVRVYPAENT